MSGELWAILGAAVLALLGALGIYRKGGRDVRRETALEAAERQAKKRKEMDDAEAGIGDDPAIARVWLAERGK